MMKGTTDIAMIRARSVVFESVETPVPADIIFQKQ